MWVSKEQKRRERKGKVVDKLAQAKSCDATECATSRLTSIVASGEQSLRSGSLPKAQTVDFFL